ncbi:MAG TPA: hypothetical protein VNI01_05655, partial [Elusimicrobiota bacterium]|nr:hypothetical protein [Elusimicrobiota bacterium]
MFCFVGQPINEAALWARLRASVEAVIGGGPGSVGCYLEPGRLRLEADGGQMTFALRPFATAAELLDVFGVPAAAVAYDGRTALMSRRGAHAHAFRVNAVDPARRDGDYEAELRRSFGCGYALAFPALDATSLQPGIPLRLPRLEVLPATVRGQLAAGSFLRPSAVAAPECVRRLCLQIEMVETNIKRLMAPGPPRFAAFGMMARAAVAAWLGDIPTDPSRLISRPALANYLASAADKALAHDRLDLNALCSVFLMDPEEVGRAAAAVARARAADPAASFTIGPTLRHIANTILERFDGLQPASWWVQADPVGEPDEAWYGSHLRRRAPASEEEASPGARRAPSEQREGPALAGGPAGRTSSTDLPVLGPAGAPSPSAPEPARAQPGPADPPASEQVPSAEQKAGPAEYKEMLAYVEGRTRSDADPTCAICSESVTRGAVNSVHLGCGHNYHWGATGGCAGLAKWCRRSDTCPTCRARFDGSPSSAPG